MSKQTLRKFKKNDFSFDEDEEYVDHKNKIDKRKQKRFERALKTKDISALIETDELMDDWD
jgi:hypothetical protein